MGLPMYSGGMVRTVTGRVDAAGGATENLVSYSLDGWYFVLRSIPCFATGLARGDIVHCVEDDGALRIEEVIVRGGASTLRLIVDDQPGLREHVAGQLATAGCGVERIGDHLLAVSVAPDVALRPVEDYLDDLAGDGVLQVLPGYIHQ